MAINFPASPSTNDIHVDGANRWQWNGSSWTRIGGASSDSDVVNSTNDNSTTTLYPVMVSGTGNQTAKIATTATKNISFDASEGDLTVGGNISVGGTITYEDVKNVDSIGIVTARAGVIVTGNVDTDTLNVSGISTLTGGINVGTAGTISSAGNITLDKPGAGIITATRFVGSGVSLTDVISGVGIRTAGGTVGWAATILDFRGPGVTTAYYSSVTGVGTVHFTGGGGSASVSISESAPSSPSAGDMWWDSDVGNLQIYYTDANSSQWVTANNSGPQGPQGAQGAQGRQGATGAQGHQGVQGAQGHQGHQGVQGAQGHQGRQGSVGIASLTISQTPPSSPAQGDMWWDSDDSTLGLYYNDGNSSQWVNINHGPSGAQGAAGAQGAQGHQGVQGAQGHQGVQGAQGHQGHQGVQGAANATTINNNANNRVITGSGTANTLEAEAKLTFDGTGSLHLNNSTGSSDAVLKIEAESGQDAYLALDTSNGGGATADIRFQMDGTTKGTIEYVNNGSNINNMLFRTGSNTERLRITSDGKFGFNTTDTSGNQRVTIKQTSHDTPLFLLTDQSNCYMGLGNSAATNGYIGFESTTLTFHNSGKKAEIDTSGNLKLLSGNLVIGTSGKGIDFSATSDGAGTDSSELFDDYEEGSWTPVLSFANYSVGTQSNSGSYVKIGNMCHCEFTLHVNSSQITGSPSSGGWVRITGIPYNASNSVGYQYLGNPAACGKLKQYVGQNGSNDFNKIFFYMPGNSSYMQLGANKDPQTSIGTDYLYGLSEETWAGAVNDSSNHNTEMRASFSYRTI